MFASSSLGSYKIIFYPKFLTLTIKIHENRSKIDSTKIIINLVTELKSYLKRYLKRKLYLKVVT